MRRLRKSRARKYSWWSFVEERKEMVAPYSSYMDETTITEHVNASLFKEKVAYNYNRTIYDILPKHLIMDIYNLYYNKSIDHEYAILNDTNKGKWKILEASNDSSLKIITNGNSVNSIVFTTEICRAILHATLNMSENSMQSLIQSMDNVKAEMSKDGDNDNTDNNDNNTDNSNTDNSSNASSNNDKSDTDSEQDCEPTQFEETVEEMSALDQRIHTAKKDAFDRIHQLEQLGITKNVYNGSEIELLKDIDTIISQVKSISHNTASIRSMLETIVNKSTGYFSKQFKTKELSILESDDLDDLDGLENFHPILKKLHFDQISTYERKYKGKITVYIDISGSMKQTCRFGNAIITKILFVKSLLLKMLELGLLNKIIPFNDNVKDPVNTNMIDILTIKSSGGTSIDNAIKDCEKGNDNCVIITDCEDHVVQYSSRAFIIGTPDASFNLSKEANNFTSNSQLWILKSSGEMVKY